MFGPLVRERDARGPGEEVDAETKLLQLVRNQFLRRKDSDMVYTLATNTTNLCRSSSL